MRLTVTTYDTDPAILDRIRKLVDALGEIRVEIIKSSEGGTLRDSNGQTIAVWALED